MHMLRFSLVSSLFSHSILTSLVLLCHAIWFYILLSEAGNWIWMLLTHWQWCYLETGFMATSTALSSPLTNGNIPLRSLPTWELSARTGTKKSGSENKTVSSATTKPTVTPPITSAQTLASNHQNQTYFVTVGEGKAVAAIFTEVMISSSSTC